LAFFFVCFWRDIGVITKKHPKTGVSWGAVAIQFPMTEICCKDTYFPDTCLNAEI
jgi:hypothetical protein